MELNTQIKEALKKGNWYIDSSERLRLAETRVYCPITYAYYLETKEQVGLDRFRFIANRINLSDDSALSIMRAADNLIYSEDLGKLREEMIKIAITSKITKLQILWNKLRSFYKIWIAKN